MENFPQILTFAGNALNSNQFTSELDHGEISVCWIRIWPENPEILHPDFEIREKVENLLDRELATFDVELKTTPKNRIMLENELIQFMTADNVSNNELQVDSVVVDTFIGKFNNKYSDELLEEQKNLEKLIKIINKTWKMINIPFKILNKTW